MNRDIISSISLYLNYDDIKKVCNTSVRYDEIICNNDLFWKNKLEIDFPQWKEQIFIEYEGNLKNVKRGHKDIYESLAKKYGINNIKIHISFYDAEKRSKNEDNKDINISTDLKFKNLQKGKDIIIDGINSFLSAENIWGRYTLFINGNLSCKSKTSGFVKIDRNCLENIEKDSEIYLRIGMRNFSYLRKDRYKKSLKENMDYSIRSV